MNGYRICALIFLLLAACTRPDSSNPGASDSSTAPGRGPSPVDQVTMAPEEVIRNYYDAIGARDFRRAYLLWGDSGRQSNQTFEQFRAGFEHIASVHVRVGEPGRIEGAAGSRYVEIPVGIEAGMDSGSLERYVGSYTLRRSVVDGATDAQMRWHIYDAEIARCPSTCPEAGDVASEVADVVDRFGKRLRMVSLLGPRDTVVRAIREQYAPLITPELLARWTRDPSGALGRHVSNPWPQRFGITDAKDEGADISVVRAEIVYVTSADTTSAVDRVPVTLRLNHGADGDWRISDVDQSAR